MYFEKKNALSSSDITKQIFEKKKLRNRKELFFVATTYFIFNFWCHTMKKNGDGQMQKTWPTLIYSDSSILSSRHHLELLDKRKKWENRSSKKCAAAAEVFRLQNQQPKKL